MVRPDVITCNPASIDYPFWRWEMEKNRDKFNDIINVFYNDYRKDDYRDFIRTVTPWGINLDVQRVPRGDWRDWSVNAALSYSHSEWVLFLEQDFVPDERFWDIILKDAEGYGVTGFLNLSTTDSWQDGAFSNWQTGIRIHPAFILTKRQYVEMTNKDFGAHPENGRDHFATFTDELFTLNIPFLNLRSYHNWKHYAGVYGNYMLVLQGEKANYQPEEFKEYVKLAMESPVTQDPRFLKWSKECLK